MSLLYLFILATIQGITEFLPISSSGHLILLPNLLNHADQGQLIDVAVHLGTLGAVLLYFWADFKEALFGFLRLLQGKIDTRGAFLALCLIIATVPVIIAGLIFKLTGLSDLLRSTAVIGWTMLGFGLLLFWADRTGTEDKPATAWTLKDALVMGFAQILALIPGTSRSGITITAARKLGYGREDAARLSMLMSVPVILASGTLLGLEVVGTANLAAARDGAIAAAFAFIAALLALSVMMRLLKTVSYTPYVIYRVILGMILLVIAYS